MKCRLIILLLLSLLFASPLCAETLPVSREYTAKLNLQAFEEGIEVLLKKNNIPGGIVVIADSNGVIFEKGFGLRDLETGGMMDPASSVFRMASVAKAYTSTGILQLLEEGILSLDTPINEYLTNLSIDYDTNTPITLRHLLTHTEGFENNFTGILTDDDNDFIPLADYLKKNRPIPIITPGEFVTYGNDGTKVAGLIIEEVTGLSFEASMDKAIFNPLKMSRSGLNKIPDDLMPFFAQEYVLENDATNVRQSLVYPLFAPGGGLYSSAGDQARFLQAMLNHSILSPPSRKQMFTGQFYNDERLPGMTFGFIENKQFSVPTYYRDGDGIGFKSRIVFIPDYDLGIMIYSNNDNDHFREQVVQLFMKQLNSIPDNEYVPLETELISYTGYYRINTYARKDFTKLQTLFSGLLQVSVDEDEKNLSFHLSAKGMPLADSF